MTTVEPKPRDINTIIKLIINEFPSNETNNEYYVALSELRTDIIWCAPEMIINKWIELQNIVNNYLAKANINSPQWQKNIINIFCDKVVI